MELNILKYVLLLAHYNMAQKSTVVVRKMPSFLSFHVASIDLLFIIVIAKILPNQCYTEKEENYNKH